MVFIQEMIYVKESIEALKILGLITNVEKYQKIYNHVWKKQNSRI